MGRGNDDLVFVLVRRIADQRRGRRPHLVVERQRPEEGVVVAERAVDPLLAAAVLGRDVDELSGGLQLV